MNRMAFTVAKSFGRLHLIPEVTGLRLIYVPVVNGQSPGELLNGKVYDESGEEVDIQKITGACNILIPLEHVGGLWATARAFLYGVESLDENIIIPPSETDPEQNDVLIKLYRDKPKGAQGSLSGDELCWMRIVSGRTEEERRRIKMGPRDLLCIELACNAVLTISSSTAYLNDYQASLGVAPKKQVRG